MRFQQALKIMAVGFKPKGYMVTFEHKQGCILRGDCFPDKHAGETLIPSEDDAWELARKFAEKTTGKCVNIYVVSDDFHPVKGYRDRIIENRASQLADFMATG